MAPLPIVAVDMLVGDQTSRTVVLHTEMKRDLVPLAMGTGLRPELGLWSVYSCHKIRTLPSFFGTATIGAAH